MSFYTTNAVDPCDFCPVLGEIKREIRFIGTGETLGYCYLMCKKISADPCDFCPVLGEIKREIRFIGTGETLGYCHLMCKKISACTCMSQLF